MATRDKNPSRHDRKTQERQRDRGDRDEPRERKDRERGDRSAPRGRDERPTPQAPRRENSSTTGARSARRSTPTPTPSPPPPRPAAPDDPLHASVSAGTAQLRLLLRDPHYAWAFWEITADAFEAARQRLGRFSQGAELVLRVHSGGPGVGASWRRGTRDTPIEDWIGARPLLLGPAGVQHVAAVGLRAATPPHVFVAIARSEPLIPPERARRAEPAAQPAWSAPNAKADAHQP